MVHIRHVEPADAAQWTALRTALWPEEPNTHAAEVSGFFSEPREGLGLPEAVLVAVVPGDPAGFVGFAELSRRAYAEGCETSPVGFLEGWYVAPAYRRQGVGRALVLAAESWAHLESVDDPPLSARCGGRSNRTGHCPPTGVSRT